MCTWLRLLLGLCVGAVAAKAEAEPTASPTAAPPAKAIPDAAPATTAKPAPEIRRIYVIPVREQIGSAVLYVVRRGIKEAIEQRAEAVIFDMDTPGGALDKTMSIMEAIGRFPGRTLTYVNTDAISAGAFISATTDEIWFAPRGKIGAAAPVGMSGQDIDKTMRQKVVSYLKAEVRSLSEGKGYRGQVVSAMIDEDYELKIGDTVLKPKGELLTLTASEAAKTYGEPPQPLLSAGTADTLEQLVTQRFGAEHVQITRLELTWSEVLATWLNAISPVLLGLGMLALFIEFKTPGFGIFGIIGIACLALVFLGNYIAGLSGHEPLLVFGLGLLFVAVEIFFFPGVGVLALAGVVLVLGSLFWSMADFWPKEAVPVAWTADIFLLPALNLTLGVLVAIALGVVLARFLPRGWVWDRLVLAAAIAGNSQRGADTPEVKEASLIGARGVAVTALRPGGVVEVEGQRYEATVEVGDVAPGEAVVVRGRSDFALIVERLNP
ncbi:NfeD family protein [Opitutus terrae]|uniref:Uncharacterized protein n=1 Tax=Opitutus terrae (strain DSM 11246 / JCM 15787 / PB90-1) TaxID=452637 RepID=B1ZUR2_OPITP|nr:NfeD family protein [Opitutus terrae]ACB74946.1 protein of unknown function DUF107 [Opitutus terrae PB90-1]